MAGTGFQLGKDAGLYADGCCARAQEALLPIRVRLWMTGGSPLVNLRLVRA